MNIGSQIKKLRRERGITQEQLAEFLNISVPAISQWECGKTAPDISQLPLLTNIFKVSADVILGIDVDKTEEKIAEIYTMAGNYSVEGFHEKAVETLRNGLAEFPNSYKLMAKLLSELYTCYVIGVNGYNKNSHLEELSSLCQVILDGCTDNDVINGLLPLICGVYKKTNRQEEAVKLAKSMPIYQTSSNELLTSIYTGDKLIEQLKINIMALNSTLVSNILDIIDQKHDNGTQVYNDDEKLIICQKIINIMEIIFEDGDYYYHSQYIRIAHYKMLMIYVNQEDTDNTLTQLEHYAKYAAMFDTYDQKANHNSILFKGMKTTGYCKWMPDQNEQSWLLQEISNPHYDFIRDNPRFIAVETLLKNTK